MTPMNNPMEDSLKAAHTQCSNQIQQAMHLLNGAMNTLKGAQTPSILNPTSSSQPTTPSGPLGVSNSNTGAVNTEHNAPIMNALRSSMSNAHQAIKAAEEGVKHAMATAEQHVQNTMKSFIEHPQINPAQPTNSPTQISGNSAQNLGVQSQSTGS